MPETKIIFKHTHFLLPYSHMCRALYNNVLKRFRHRFYTNDLLLPDNKHDDCILFISIFIGNNTVPAFG
jgi:hypothetical protein